MLLTGGKGDVEDPDAPVIGDLLRSEDNSGEGGVGFGSGSCDTLSSGACKESKYDS